MTIASLVLIIGSITSLILFSMIYFGVRNNKQMNELDKNMNSSTSEMTNNLKKVLESLESNKEQQNKIIERLQNLETIVTSEAWVAINDENDAKNLEIFLENENTDEISTEEKAQNLAKRIKH